MPNSSFLCKRETRAFIKKHFSFDMEILDIGCGKGTYAKLLPEFRNIDGVEAYGPYISQYKLEKFYRQVFSGDCTEMKFGRYDLAILGDVLEHIPKEKALKFIDYLKSDVASNILVIVPYNSQQDEYKGNVFEKHFQDTLTPLVFSNTYHGFFCISEGEKDGVHIGAWIWPEDDPYEFAKCETDKFKLVFLRLIDFLKGVFR